MNGTRRTARPIPTTILLLFLAGPATAGIAKPVADHDEFPVKLGRQNKLKVLANDVQLDDKPVKMQIVSPPFFGKATVKEDKLILYVPDDDFPGRDAFVYRLTDADGDSSEARVQLRSRNLFEKLDEKYGLSLRNSLLGKVKEKKPATLAFLTTIRDDTIFAADFLIAWAPRWSHRVGRAKVEYELSAEGKVSSKESESEDAWRFRGTSWWRTRRLLFLDGSMTSMSVKFEADQDFDTQKLMGELIFHPMRIFGSKDASGYNPRPFALGYYFPQPPLDEKGKTKGSVQFLLQPRFGLEPGYTIQQGDSEETKGVVLRVPLGLRADVYFRNLARALDIRQVNLYADDVFRFLPLEDSRDTANFLKSGLSFGFNDHLSFGLEYKMGRSAPNFDRIETFGGTLGVKF
jgi:hypothetical protein